MNLDEHLFVCLMEECAEVQQAVAKGLRFGFEDHHPERPTETNEKEVLTELEQLLTLVELLQENNFLAELSLEEQGAIRNKKRAKLSEYMAYSKEKGRLA